MSAGLHVDAIDLDDERVRKQERPDSKTVRGKERVREREERNGGMSASNFT